MKTQVLAGTALLLLLGVSPVRAAQNNAQQTTTAAPQTAAPAPAQPQATPAEHPAAEATVSCGDCHDEQMKAFRGNPHAHGANKEGVVPNAVCESCHGSGTAHIENGGDPKLIFKPVGRVGSDKACLACHDTNNDRISRHGGVHANSATTNCLTCHSVHHSAAGVPRLLVSNEQALCNTCHSTQVASFRNKPFAHRIGRGGMGCASCHEPHGRPGRENLRTTLAGETPCVGCHAQMRTPHVFEHAPASQISGDCMNCHEPHGSSNPKMLKRARVYQLCLECHSTLAANTLGSQPPSFHNISQPRFQNCTTCHVAIHGSNRDPQLLK